ncbi:hypothetical protein ABW20_dc0101601 [Dactylellina cionopaga]|nr:hypothetical protein ABW20_dc0101601 [Dactylellina cionopaga]
MSDDRDRFDIFYNWMLERRSKGDNNFALDVEIACMQDRDQTSKFIRSAGSYIAGGAAHGNQPNERQAVSHHGDGTVIRFTLTAVTSPDSRDAACTYNEFSKLLFAAMEDLGYSPSRVELLEAFGVDGSAGILAAVIDGGKCTLLAKGGQKQVHLPLDMDRVTNWRMANALIETESEYD